MTKSFNSDVFLEKEHTISNIKIHEDFNDQTLENDIAIILLENAVQPSSFVKVAGFTTTQEDFLRNQTLHFAGWDISKAQGRKVYQQFPMDLESSPVCKKILRAVGSASHVDESQVITQNLLVLSETSGTLCLKFSDMCKLFKIPK